MMGTTALFAKPQCVNRFKCDVKLQGTQGSRQAGEGLSLGDEAELKLRAG